MAYKSIIVPVRYKLHHRYEGELSAKILYLSDTIVDFRFYEEGEYIDRIELICNVGTWKSSRSTWELDNIKTALEILLQKDFSTPHTMEEKTVWRVLSPPEKELFCFQALVSRGWVNEAATGQIVLSEPLITLFDYLDQKIRRFALSELKAVEYQYPTLIPKSTVDLCGYVDNSAHLLYYVNSLHHDPQTYCEFQKNRKSSPSKINRYLREETEYCLPPTMCYHTYHQFRGKELPRPFVVTSRGKSFRNEERYAIGMERMVDFTIREIVFFGNYRFVQSVRELLIDFGAKLFQDLHIAGYCSSASDMFFLADNAETTIKMQKQLKFKLEFRAYLGSEKDVSIGSVNYHDSFFSRNFQLSMKETPYLVSGCAGFGLERLVYAFISQNGIDPQKWPISLEKMRGGLFDE